MTVKSPANKPTARMSRTLHRVPKCLRVITAGAQLPDGALIEVLCDRSLLLWNGSQEIIATSIEHGGFRFLPPAPRNSFWNAFRLPERAGPAASAREVFVGLKELFEQNVEPQTVATLLAAFAMSSWLADFLPLVPGLWISGADGDGHRVLDLMKCVCRQALSVLAFTPAVFSALPLGIRPTLVLSHPSLTEKAMHRLATSGRSGVYLPRGKILLDCACPKVVLTTDQPLDPQLATAFVGVVLSGQGGAGEVLSRTVQEQITQTFQPKLLRFRLDYAHKVRDGACLDTDFGSPPSELAQVLAACVVEEQLQHEIVRLLRPQQQAVVAARSMGLQAVTLEALLLCCHEGKSQATVAEICKLVNVLLQQREEGFQVSAKKVGAVLRGLGVEGQRTAIGWTILFLKGVRERVHSLARAYSVPLVGDSAKGCAVCEAMCGRNSGERERRAM